MQPGLNIEIFDSLEYVGGNRSRKRCNQLKCQFYLFCNGELNVCTLFLPMMVSTIFSNRLVLIENGGNVTKDRLTPLVQADKRASHFPIVSFIAHSLET